MLTKFKSILTKDTPKPILLEPEPSIFSEHDGFSKVAETNSKTLDDHKLMTIARASIALSQLAPKLSDLAQTLLAGAHQQSQQSLALASATEKMTDDLKDAIQNLSNSSGQVNRIVNTIKEVADQTKIIAINASIEAARAGVYGQAFGVVANEVGSLADKTQDATGNIHDSLKGMQKDITHAVDATGIYDDKSDSIKKEKKDSFSVYRLNEDMHEIADIANTHLSSADSISQTSEEIRNFCEELLLNIGTCRLESHDMARRIFEPFLSYPDVMSSIPARQTAALREIISRNDIFELLYMTDESGVQQIDNIWPDPTKDGSDARGSSWRDRDWYKKTLRNNSTTISDIYRSSATDNFCFTISAPVRNENGQFIGVLAADVNFAKLL
jgi:hypothetical protein